jgi:hypothetical protein
VSEGEGSQVSRRARRIEEAILEIEGVAGVRVWELPGRVEIGVRVAPSDTPADVIVRVNELTSAMREGDESWDVGVLTEG